MGGEVTGAKAPSAGWARGRVERAGAERPSLGCCNVGLVTEEVPETCFVPHQDQWMPIYSTLFSRRPVPSEYEIPEPTILSSGVRGRGSILCVLRNHSWPSRSDGHPTLLLHAKQPPCKAIRCNLPGMQRSRRPSIRPHAIPPDFQKGAASTTSAPNGRSGNIPPPRAGMIGTFGSLSVTSHDGVKRMQVPPGNAPAPEHMVRIRSILALGVIRNARTARSSPVPCRERRHHL